MVSTAHETLENILAQAHSARASDIHLEPLREALRVRLRIDGVLHEWSHLPIQQASALVSTVKLWSRLPLDEKRLPLDGRFSWQAAHELQHQYRVAVATGVLGESITLRRIDAHREVRSFEKLGMQAHTLEAVNAALARADGMVLVSGPTGSGKTTSLYAMLELLRERALKIITVEDPVERIVPGVCQVAVNEAVGFDAARALKAILRQAPNVIMIGEIREESSAQIAMQAALTGHAVLGSIHTEDAIGVWLRLANLGIAPTMVAAGLQGVMAQRLVRRLCPHCAVDEAPQAWERTFLGDPCPEVLKHPRGCTHCSGTGYYGRIGIFEWIGAHPELLARFARNEPIAALSTCARSLGFESILQEGTRKVLEGVTSLREVLANLGSLKTASCPLLQTRSS